MARYLAFPVASPAAAHERPSRSHPPSVATHPRPHASAVDPPAISLFPNFPSAPTRCTRLIPIFLGFAQNRLRTATSPPPSSFSHSSNLRPFSSMCCVAMVGGATSSSSSRRHRSSPIVTLLLACLLRCSSCAGDKSSPSPLFYRLFFFLYTAAMAAPGAECWRPKPPLVPRPRPCKAVRTLQAELTSLLRCRRSAAPQSASSPSPLAALPAQVPGQRGTPCCEAPA
jgi:hypothetical protein